MVILFIVWAALEVIMGTSWIGDIATITDALSKAMSWDTINSGTGCAMIQSAYDKLELKSVSVLWEWPDTPYMTLLSSSQFSGIEYGLYAKGVDY